MKKTLVVLLAFIMMFTMIPFAVAEEVVTVDVMIENRSDTEKAAWENLLLPAFHEAFPNIKINLLYTPETMTVIKTQLAGGDGADMLFLDGPTAAMQLWQADKLMNLDEYYEKYGWGDILAQWAQGTVKYDGSFYAIPADVEAMVLYYNPDLCEELGIGVPTNVTELYDYCQIAVDNGYTALSFGNGTYITDIDHWISTIYNCYAGVEDLKAALRGELKWNEGTLKGAIQAYDDLWQAGYINDKMSYAISNDDATALFYNSMAPYKMCGTWLYGNLVVNMPDTSWDLATFPALRDDVAAALPMGLGEAIAINAAAPKEKADAAAEFLNFMLTNVDIHAQMIPAGMMPLPIDIPTELFPEETDPRFLTQMQILNDAQANLENSGLVLWTFFPPELRQWQIDNMDKVFMGTMTVDEFCDGTQEVFEKCLADGTVPPLP